MLVRNQIYFSDIENYAKNYARIRFDIDIETALLIYPYPISTCTPEVITTTTAATTTTTTTTFLLVPLKLYGAYIIPFNIGILLKS